MNTNSDPISRAMQAFKDAANPTDPSAGFKKAGKGATTGAADKTAAKMGSGEKLTVLRPLFDFIENHPQRVEELAAWIDSPACTCEMANLRPVLQGTKAQPLLDILKDRYEAVRNVVSLLKEAHDNDRDKQQAQTAITQLVNRWGEGILFKFVGEVGIDATDATILHGIAFATQDKQTRDQLFAYEKWQGNPELTDARFYAAAALSAHNRNETDRETTAATYFVNRVNNCIPAVAIYKHVMTFLDAPPGSIFEQKIVQGLTDYMEKEGTSLDVVDGRAKQNAQTIYMQLAARQDIPTNSRLWTLVDEKMTAYRQTAMQTQISVGMEKNLD